jgi:hypothetical protein
MVNASINNAMKHFCSASVSCCLLYGHGYTCQSCSCSCGTSICLLLSKLCYEDTCIIMIRVLLV